MKQQSPCLNCKNRYINCHSKCVDYIEYVQCLEQIRINKKKIMDEYYISNRKRKKNKK